MSGMSIGQMFQICHTLYRRGDCFLFICIRPNEKGATNNIFHCFIHRTPTYPVISDDYIINYSFLFCFEWQLFSSDSH